MLFASLHTTNVVAILLIGLVAGCLASLIVGGGGLWRDLDTGLVGAVVGAVLLRAFGIVLPFRDPLGQYRLSPSRLGDSKPMKLISTWRWSEFAEGESALVTDVVTATLGAVVVVVVARAVA